MIISECNMEAPMDAVFGDEVSLVESDCNDSIAYLRERAILSFFEIEDATPTVVSVCLINRRTILLASYR
jgi:hypothetical protein